VEFIAILAAAAAPITGRPASEDEATAIELGETIGVSRED
jgi:hypothetical protein